MGAMNVLQKRQQLHTVQLQTNLKTITSKLSIQETKFHAGIGRKLLLSAELSSLEQLPVETSNCIDRCSGAAGVNRTFLFVHPARALICSVDH